ncbi:MAG TPA: hypothetical protein VGJ21_13945 [Terracidiphilus sp.]|jgi:hypothetical protein
MDFRIKKGRDGRGGLVMHLLPGRYRGAVSFDEAITVREGPFWFLEHAIRERCSDYRRYSHYGRVVVPRGEWAVVLSEWQNLKLRAQSSRLPFDLGILKSVPIDDRKKFLADFPRNCRKLVLLIDQLTLWVNQELQTSD